MTDLMAIHLRVNGVDHHLAVEPRRLLVDVIRDDLALTGTHVGCGYGVCGTCTVIIDDVAQRSCLTLAVQAHDRHVTTVEGLSAPNGDLSRLQECFSEHRGLQCGFCTPGLLMSLTALSASGEPIDDTQINDTVEGHLCRCTGYTGIIDSARAALLGDPE